MKNKFWNRAVVLSLLAALLLLAVMGGVSFAWFSAANRQVSTRRVAARTGRAELELEVSENARFTGDTTQTVIRQVNRANALELMPVSTDDLLHFVYCPVTDNAVAANFKAVTDESYYFHGRFYIRAAGSGLSPASFVSVYIDASETDRPLTGLVDGLMLNAARMGIRVSDGGETQTVILRLSNTGNGAGAAMNTRVNGVDQAEGIVLHSGGTNQVSAVRDPAVYWEDCAFRADGTAPNQELFRLKPNAVYTLDFYFYLEGCDPDCTNIISADLADVGLRFYGMAS